MNELLLYFSLKNNGNWEDVYNDIENKKEINKQEFEHLLAKLKSNEIEYITINHKKYPEWLKSTVKPPFVIFYKGNIKKLKDKNIFWIYGSYEYENKIKLEKMLTEFKKNKGVILTGTKNIVEIEINRHCDDNKIVVLENGFLNANKQIENLSLESNLVISEYPFARKDSDYETDNKLKWSIAEGTILLNSLKTEYLFLTLSSAIEDNNLIYCLEENNKKSHNNILIENGAIGVKTIKDVF